jgi:hypothetical protein
MEFWVLLGFENVVGLVRNHRKVNEKFENLRKFFHFVYSIFSLLKLKYFED